MIVTALHYNGESLGHYTLHAFVVMPNHIHGIVRIAKRPAGGVPVQREDDGVEKGAASSAPTDGPTLGEIIRAFKSISARAVNRQRGRCNKPVWQRNYYDRVIRDEAELGKIREYIATNVLRWGCRGDI